MRFLVFFLSILNLSVMCLAVVAVPSIDFNVDMCENRRTACWVNSCDNLNKFLEYWTEHNIQLRYCTSFYELLK